MEFKVNIVIRKCVKIQYVITLIVTKSILMIDEGKYYLWSLN